MERTKENLTVNNPYIKRNLPRFEKLWFGVFLIVMIVLFLLYGTILSFLYNLRPRNYTDAVYLLHAPTGAWYFVGLVLSIGTTGIVMI